MENPYEQLVKLIPGLQVGMDNFEATEVILNEILRLKQEIADRDMALQIMSNELIYK
jgi:hypothetical protein